VTNNVVARSGVDHVVAVVPPNAMGDGLVAFQKCRQLILAGTSAKRMVDDHIVRERGKQFLRVASGRTGN